MQSRHMLVQHRNAVWHALVFALCAALKRLKRVEHNAGDVLPLVPGRYHVPQPLPRALQDRFGLVRRVAKCVHRVFKLRIQRPPQMQVLEYAYIFIDPEFGSEATAHDLHQHQHIRVRVAVLRQRGGHGRHVCGLPGPQ